MSRRKLAAALFLLLSSTYPAFAQKESTVRPFSTVGIGVKVSTLGPGFQAATPLSRHFNLRGGLNWFSYDRSLTSNGIDFNAKLQLRSAELHLDWFPFRGGFHLSPGALIYNGNQISGAASVPGNDTFKLNSVQYASDPANPVTGNAALNFVRAAPMIVLGWGSLVPRTRHISVPFEFGVVFQGSPQVALNLNGNVCDPDGTNCRAISSDPTVQANIQAQQNKISNDVSAFKYYPVISIGVGYKF